MTRTEKERALMDDDLRALLKEIIEIHTEEEKVNLVTPVFLFQKDRPPFFVALWRDSKGNDYTWSQLPDDAVFAAARLKKGA